MNDYHLFSEAMKRVFDYPVKGRQAVCQLFDLTQGKQSVSQYAIRFHILAAESGWGDSAQRQFSSGEIKDELAVREDSSSLNTLIDLAIRLDNRRRERSRERKESGKLRFLTAPQLSPLGD